MTFRKTTTALRLSRVPALSLALVMAIAPAWADELTPASADLPVDLPYQAPAAVNPATQAEVERLMDLFQVRRVLAMTTEQAMQDSRLNPEQIDCLRGVLTVDRMYAEIRHHYTDMFSDPAVRTESIAFLSAPTGNKVIAMMIDTLVAGEKPDPVTLMAKMTPEELQEIVTFSATPAGRMFREISGKTGQMQQESMQRIIPEVARQCGHLQKKS